MRSLTLLLSYSRNRHQQVSVGLPEGKEASSSMLELPESKNGDKRVANMETILASRNVSVPRTLLARFLLCSQKERAEEPF